MNPLPEILTLADLVVPFLFVPLILLLIGYIKARFHWNKPWDKFLLAGFFVRMVSVVFFALIYQYYYKYGDTFIYYKEAVNIRSTFFNGDFDSFFEMIFSDYRNFSPKTLNYINHDYLYYMSNNQILIAIAGICNIFCFNSYVAIAILFTTFGYIGTFILFRELCRLYPDYYKPIAVILIFFPTSFFWGAGLMKEPLCLGAISFIIYGCIRIFNRSGKLWGNLIVITIASFLLASIKSYILYSFIAGLIIALTVTGLYKIPIVAASKKLQRLIPFLFLGIISISVIFLSTSLTNNAAQLIIGEIAATQSAQIQASIDAGGSGYTLTDLDPTPFGIFSFSMSALVTSLFRPWVWELNKPILVLNAIEALITLVFTAWIVFKIGIRAIVSQFIKHLLPTTLLLYTLILGIVIGVISFNYGTLVRYKAPLLGFYFLSLLLVYIKNKQRISNEVK